MRFLLLSKYGFQDLLGVLVLYLMAGPFLNPFPLAHVVVDILLSAGLLLAVYVIHKRIKLPFATVPLLVVVVARLVGIQVAQQFMEDT
jgi:hypothetical protein